MKKKILIVVANYYKEISKTLVKSTIKKMNNFAKVKIIKVPGVFEIPVTIVKNIKKYDGIIALGCIIKVGCLALYNTTKGNKCIKLFYISCNNNRYFKNTRHSNCANSRNPICLQCQLSPT